MEEERAQRKRETALRNLAIARRKSKELIIPEEPMEEELTIPEDYPHEGAPLYVLDKDHLPAIVDGVLKKLKEDRKRDKEEGRAPKRVKTISPSTTTVPTPPPEQTKQEVEGFMTNIKEHINNSTALPILSSFAFSILSVYTLTSIADWLKKTQLQRSRFEAEQNTFQQQPKKSVQKVEETPQQNNPATQEDYSLL
jgi:hypothetical protein